MRIAISDRFRSPNILEHSGDERFRFRCNLVGKLIFMVPVLRQLTVAARQNVAILAEQRQLFVLVHVAVEMLATRGRVLILLYRVLFRFDRVILRDF